MKSMPLWKVGLTATSGLGIAALALLDRRLYAKDNLILLVLRLVIPSGKLLAATSDEEVALIGRPRDTGELKYAAERLGYTQETVMVDVEGGQIAVHVHRPQAKRDNLAMVVWFHGGGMCLGTAQDAQSLLKFGYGVLEHFRGEAVVASVDYRMAPAHKFPVGAEDAVAATMWLQEHALRFGCDPARVSVAGPSAGGYLAAVVHQAARDRGFPLACAVIMEPMCRYGATTPSYHENGKGFGLTQELMLWFWKTYCPDPKMAEDPRCEPIRGIGQGNLAPCIVGTVEYDPLRDEGVEYFEALQKAGVDATHLRFATSHMCPPADKRQLSALLHWWSSALGVAAGKPSSTGSKL